MSITIEKLLAVIADFIERARGETEPIGADTLLLQDGYLDSFSLAELIIEIEEKLGITVPEGALLPEDFETATVLLERLAQIGG